jgi:hypothetical protein
VFDLPMGGTFILEPMKHKIIYLLFTFFIAHGALAHQMDKLGPNGGFVKMPGAYHMELVETADSLKVYLLDMNFKDALTKNSSVSIVYSGTKQSQTNCKEQENHFICPKPKEGLNQYKFALVSSTRNKIKGGVARYDLPLKLPAH